ncbi:MAG: PilT/PilU family type 4a pilus ATPase [Opitutaceae bacterium]|jgi:twitching motility protein PilT|nr:PilT/PilU family type 4a pilus ATPase [Opitutaceae bacterium]
MPDHTPVEIFNALLKLGVDSGASDVVVKTGTPGHLRLSGKLNAVEMEPFAKETVEGFVLASVPEGVRPAWKANSQIDYSYVVEGLGRFRVNAFRQRGTVSVVFRYIKNDVPTLEGLQLPAGPILRITNVKDGIIIVCGATGCGKSSTLAAMLNWINQNLDRHVITLEDPIEYTFDDNKSVFQQREVGLDVPTFELGITSVLRQNPDIIFIGEMRDRITFETAISAAETGHLVLTTMHANTVAQGLTRLFEFFPAEEQTLARRQVSNTLRGLICQKLIPTLGGGGRVPACEILTADAVVKNLIAEAQTEKITSMMETGTDSASFSFNRELLRLFKTNKITRADAIRFSPNPQALDMNMKGIFFKT